jgi:hypothetical protein
MIVPLRKLNQQEMPQFRSFPGVSLYVGGVAMAVGTATLERCSLGAFIYFRDDSACGPFP